MTLPRAALALALTTAACTAGTSDPPDDPGYALVGKADSAWCHFDFTSREGTAVRVDYVTSASPPVNNIVSVTADPLWINAVRSDFGSVNDVSVRIDDKSYYATTWNVIKDFGWGTLDLYRSEDDTRFTGQVPGGLRTSEAAIGDDEEILHSHAFEVTVDGVVQTDPVSGTADFSFHTLGCYDQ